MATERRATGEDEREQNRAAVPQAAHEVGRMVGEWLGRVLARAAEEGGHPPATAREDIAGRLDARLRSVEEALGQLAKRVAALEAEVGRDTRPPMGRTAAPREARREDALVRAGRPQKRRGPPRRELPEPVRTKIDELHAAGRSAYAISKELGIPYHVVHGYLKARDKRA